MICPFSGNECQNPPTCFITEIVNNEPQSFSICKECIAKNSKKNLLSFVKEIMNKFYPATNSKTKVCPKCNSTFQDFLKNQRIGCANCYDVFQNELLLVVYRAQGGYRKHVGKYPKSQPNFINKALEEAIANEDYEQANELKKLLPTKPFQ